MRWAEVREAGGSASVPRAPRDEPEAMRGRYFGQRLRELRETFGERTAGRGATDRRRMTAGTLLECMRQAGHSISLAAFSEIENGLTFPRDTSAFIDAVAACLQLTDDETRDLEAALAHDLIYARLGERGVAALAPRALEQLTPRRPSIFGIVLRMCREQARVTCEQLARCLLVNGLPLGTEASAQDSEAIIAADRVALLAARIARIETAAIHEQWPLECTETEFIARVATCLPAQLFADMQLARAQAIDLWARESRSEIAGS
jgi:hypothetical protein